MPEVTLCRRLSTRPSRRDLGEDGTLEASQGRFELLYDPTGPLDARDLEHDFIGLATALVLDLGSKFDELEFATRERDRVNSSCSVTTIFVERSAREGRRLMKVQWFGSGFGASLAG